MLIAACSVRPNCLLYLVSIVVPPILSCVQWSVSVGQEHIVCGRSHQGCVSQVLSGLPLLFFNPLIVFNLSLLIVGSSAVITRNFVDDIGSEVGRRSGLRFGE